MIPIITARVRSVVSASVLESVRDELRELAWLTSVVKMLSIAGVGLAAFVALSLRVL